MNLSDYRKFFNFKMSDEDFERIRACGSMFQAMQDRFNEIDNLPTIKFSELRVDKYFTAINKPGAFISCKSIILYKKVKPYTLFYFDKIANAVTVNLPESIYGYMLPDTTIVEIELDEPVRQIENVIVSGVS